MGTKRTYIGGDIIAQTVSRSRVHPLSIIMIDYPVTTPWCGRRHSDRNTAGKTVSVLHAHQFSRLLPSDDYAFDMHHRGTTEDHSSFLLFACALLRSPSYSNLRRLLLCIGEDATKLMISMRLKEKWEHKKCSTCRVPSGEVIFIRSSLKSGLTYLSLPIYFFRHSLSFEF